MNPPSVNALPPATQRLAPGLGPMPWRDRLRRARLQVGSWLLTGLYRAGAAYPVVWRWVARAYRPGYSRVAAWHARIACQLAGVDVPAYRDFLARSDAAGARRLGEFPETSKQNYANVYDDVSRCQEGRLRPVGMVVDESSGSTGKPYTWLRGPRELRAIHRNIAGYTRLVFAPGRLFVINAYSMGPGHHRARPGALGRMPPGGRHRANEPPLLFLLGHKDSTVSYMGANLYPQDVEYGLYTGNPHAAWIARFCLSLEELPDLECRPAVNIELRGDHNLGPAERADLARVCRHGLVEHLARTSRDFAASLREDPAAGDIRIRVFEPGEGPFARLGAIKNTYLVREP